MVTNNKVLTVSYGTFSCTLEGFDDSFDTMKAIAEYFRDLAADDRYFGAEPPTPDAEMLSRIAEREIERRVQARHEAGAIVLSAGEPLVEAERDAAPQETVQEPVKEETAQDVSQEPEAEEAPVVAKVETPAEEVAEVEDQSEAIIQEAVEAGELSPDEARFDFVDAEASAEEPEVEEAIEAVAEVPAEDDAPLADEAVSDAPEAPQAEDGIAEVKSEAPEFIEDLEDEVSENLFDEGFETPTSADDVIAADDIIEDEFTEPAKAADAEDSIAAKLRRIRAVVSRVDHDMDDEADAFMEDEHADVTAEAEPVISELAQEFESAADANEDGAPAAEIAEEAPRKMPVRPRVIRMKRSDLEDAVAEGTLEEEAEEAAPKSSLSDEDEADLMAQLAEVDAEISHAPEATPEAAAEIEQPIEAPIEAEAAPRAEEQPRRTRRAKLDTATPEEDNSVDRLLEATNTKLDEPEGSRRRNAIAHLRAAVAATKAEKEAGKSLDKPDQSDAYRNDLADVMRPQKAEEPAERPARKSGGSPLKLVAAQRVDAAAEPTKSVRPRRVSPEDIAAIDANEEASNFVEFAERMGATQLPDVLEAAASYLTFVEGRHRFSRPMLMRLAYQVGEKRFEREAGLRSFGQLLRQKKIEKIAGGRFTVSESINFKPDDREAG
jgi:hypothetical protein